MNSCMASLLPAWEPPLMTLKAGTGRMISGVPAKSAMCLELLYSYSKNNFQMIK